MALGITDTNGLSGSVAPTELAAQNILRQVTSVDIAVIGRQVLRAGVEFVDTETGHTISADSFNFDISHEHITVDHSNQVRALADALPDTDMLNGTMQSAVEAEIGYEEFAKLGEDAGGALEDFGTEVGDQIQAGAEQFFQMVGDLDPSDLGYLSPDAAIANQAIKTIEREAQEAGLR